MGAAVRGGLSRWGLQLMAGWLAFSLASGVFWAVHLRGLVGQSALANYWGELLTARDLWELAANGGMRQHWTGPWVPLAAGLALLWFLWAGWRLQADAIGRPARLGPWFWGLVDALVIGAGPLALLAGLLALGCARLGATGIPVLGWLGWVLGGLVRLAFFSALFVQWWLCRLDRAVQPAGPCLGSWGRLAGHLGLSFRRFWRFPAQWLTLILGGVVLRTGLTLLALGLSWRMGGGTLPKVWACLVLQLAVVAVNAWLLGWFLRLGALFLDHEATVRVSGGVQ
jgi:hypothetical protein